MFFIMKNNPKYTFTSGFSDSEIGQETTCFEVDELIVPIISVLNQKGYKTIYSCSGHYYRYDIDEIEFYENNDNDLEKTKVTFYDTDDIHEDESWGIPYIMFSQKIKSIPNIDTIPKGWFVKYMPIDINVQLQLREKYGDIFSLIKPNRYEYRISLYYEKINSIIKKCRMENNEINIYKFYSEIIKVMSKMYDWCNSLDDYKEEN